MNIQALVNALEQQRNHAMNQNAELLAQNISLQQEIEELKKKLADIEEKS